MKETHPDRRITSDTSHTERRGFELVSLLCVQTAFMRFCVHDTSKMKPPLNTLTYVVIEYKPAGTAPAKQKQSRRRYLVGEIICSDCLATMLLWCFHVIVLLFVFTCLFSSFFSPFKLVKTSLPASVGRRVNHTGIRSADASSHARTGIKSTAVFYSAGPDII